MISRILLMLIAGVIGTTGLLGQKDAATKTVVFRKEKYKGGLMEDISGIAIVRTVYSKGKIQSVKYYDKEDELLD